ncbi:LysR family transcriptional regulator [Thiohalomonas denitrificans]|uniref:Transcriptional regulator, LysR family n=1 Tax=Thiohalomonas denitrificans TaxID=415747 RepID=A0A1G5QKA9_9GAMM|nr:LysR family transcriptional regulator [Thiohalomonas denitrificans]SCZ61761.1 transcriptional regulator, LysR family [Thiohalomonas denitrificans]
MNITLRQLKVFAAVARNLSFTRAAEELCLTQPAVSMQVKQLETQLEVALFEQLGKKIYLTEAGQEVYQYSRLITQQLDELQTVLQNLRGVGHGRLRIAVASTANYFVPTLLGTFCRRFPDVTVSLDVTNREELLTQLADNEVDLVIMGQPPAEMDLEASAIMENPLVIVAPPDHPLAQQQRIPLARLEKEIFLVREPGSGTRIAMERFFNEYNVRIATGMEVGSNEAIKQSVQAGLGLGLLSRDTVQMELELDRLVILDVQEFPILRHWYVVYRRGKRLSSVSESFKTFLLTEAAHLLGRQRSDVEFPPANTRQSRARRRA